MESKHNKFPSKPFIGLLMSNNLQCSSQITFTGLFKWPEFLKQGASNIHNLFLQWRVQEAPSTTLFFFWSWRPPFTRTNIKFQEEVLLSLLSVGEIYLLVRHECCRLLGFLVLFSLSPASHKVTIKQRKSLILIEITPWQSRIPFPEAPNQAPLSATSQVGFSAFRATLPCQCAQFYELTHSSKEVDYLPNHPCHLHL